MKMEQKMRRERRGVATGDVVNQQAKWKAGPSMHAWLAPRPSDADASGDTSCVLLLPACIGLGRLAGVAVTLLDR